MRYFFIAFQFLTIVPLPFRVRCEEQDLGRSMALFPLVGLVLGVLLVALDLLLSQVLPRTVVDLLLIAALAVVTGALHLDGLADVCDAMAARGDRERFLSIMKDSRIGAVGAVGLVLALLLKYQALLAVPREAKTVVLLLFPAVARYGQVLMTAGARSARDKGLGSLFIAGSGGAQLALALATIVSASYLCLSAKGVALVVAASLLTGLLRLYFQRRLGGITGDIIGCASELNEILCLLLIVATYDRL